MTKKLEDMDMLELKDLCRDRGIPFKDAASVEELRKRLAPKPKSAKPKK